MDHIEKSVLAYPELAERYSKLGELYDKKCVPQPPSYGVAKPSHSMIAPLPSLHTGSGISSLRHSSSLWEIRGTEEEITSLNSMNRFPLRAQF